MNRTTNQTPFAELADLDSGDYTLSVDISLDLEDDRQTADGHWAPDRREPFISSFEIAAGRRDRRLRSPLVAVIAAGT